MKRPAAGRPDAGEDLTVRAAAIAAALADAEAELRRCLLVGRTTQPVRRQIALLEADARDVTTAQARMATERAAAEAERLRQRAIQIADVAARELAALCATLEPPSAPARHVTLSTNRQDRSS